MEKKLYRNEHDKMLAGVCSGLGNYLGIEVTIVRLVMVLLTFVLVFSPIIVYIILWVILPVNPNGMQYFNTFNSSAGSQFNSANDPNDFNKAGQWENKWNMPNEGFNTNFNPDNFRPKNNNGKIIAGVILIVLGGLFLVRELEILPYWFSVRKLWPLIFVGLGLAFIFKSKKDKQFEEFKAANEKYNSTVNKGTAPDVEEKDQNSADQNQTI
ncbi:PspC domain-containing protein [Pedobacter flavus]|uniref:PspC domain-containing protein n=1 Tax=Pedobacter flavus TaxID=3113906 RepID=A0ABU7H1J5_9SPHI|nr:PspC domain-containing protein [Pedobacter sp. VNH31]MEE1885093.1 PspC domain-containing protein [Pedobacter sp. VNH31]